MICMHSSVVIKASKAGMTVILSPELPFEELIEDIGKKFRESARFWGSAQMTLTLEGRELTPVEELKVVDAITANSQLEILCLLDTDANRIARCEKALTERLMELSGRTGQFYKGSLNRGEHCGDRGRTPRRARDGEGEYHCPRAFGRHGPRRGGGKPGRGGGGLWDVAPAAYDCLLHPGGRGEGKAPGARGDDCLRL